MFDISGFGIEARLAASVSFPIGFNITEFADDADPFDLTAQQIADSAMSLNGDLVVWSTANPIPLTLNLIPGSDSDRNLDVLMEVNRVGRGKSSFRDVITMVITYPDERILTLTNGKMLTGMVGNSVATAGRLKSKPYTFSFENKVFA